MQNEGRSKMDTAMVIEKTPNYNDDGDILYAAPPKAIRPGYIAPGTMTATITAVFQEEAASMIADLKLLRAANDVAAPQPRKIVAVGFIVNHGETILVVAPEVQ